jgi:hypothetical protein
MPNSVRLRLALPAAALLLGCVLAPVSHAATNLLLNPGFEEGVSGHPWMPAAWDTFQSGLPTVFFGRDTALAHGGKYSVNVANVSSVVPMWHNWSQVVPVSKDMWNKDLVLTMWTRSNGLQGRGYVLLQAYRDTISKMAKQWKVPRDTAARRMGIVRTNDPLVTLGWKRQYFSDPETDWVKREVRIFVPPSTNIAVVRCGIFGTGQVMMDDASLTSEAAAAQPEPPLNTNLLLDPGFEGDGNDWEYSMAPYEGLEVVHDTESPHSGKTCMRYSGGLGGMIQTRVGVCQVISNRNLSSKRLRLSGFVKTDSLKGTAYLKVYCTTIDGDVHEPSPVQYSMNTPWTSASMDVDTPPDTYMVWGWFLYNAPAEGKVYFDDTSLEVLGPAEWVKNGLPPPRRQPQ